MINSKLKNKIEENYQTELNLLKKLQEKIEKFETKSDKILSMLEEIRSERNDLQSKMKNQKETNFDNEIKILDGIDNIDQEIKEYHGKAVEYRKRINQKFESLASTIQESSNPKANERNSISKFITKWLNTIKETYEDSLSM